MSSLEIIVAVLRGIHVAALASLFGTLLFVLAIVPREARPLRHTLHGVARCSAIVALLIGLTWLAVESAVIADADSIGATFAALPTVAFQTQYGQWFLARCVLLAVIASLPLVPRAGLAVALAAAAVALVIQPMIGHAGAIGGATGRLLIASETLHLLAAGAWLGGLLPLFISVGRLSPREAASACRDFTSIGVSAVLLLAGTAILQVVELIGGMPGLFGTTYGHVALVKIGLFVALLLLAALNRFVLTERVANDTGQQARRHMRASILIEAMLGAAVIVTAGFLASLTPGTHDQPVWPFPWRPSLAALYDPLLHRELVLALTATGIGAAIAIAGVIWRRGRWYALALAMIILVVAVPHLDLLFIEACPTSFYSSPTEFAATAIMHGQKLFDANCTACHGADGRGDGTAAKSLPVPPADLTAEHFWMHTDGELFWFISHGLRAPDGDIAMPGFGDRLSSEAIWDLIDFLGANNGGFSMRQTGTWSHPLQVPQFDAVCPGGNEVDLDDLRGKVLRFVAAANDEQVAPTSDATTIFLVRGGSARNTGDTCVSTEPQTWNAFAILLGQDPDALANWQILADQNAWLRAAWHPGAPGNWDNPQALGTAIRAIRDHPLTISLPGGHVHRH